jgi:type I restriction enzyme M protein
LKKLEASAEEAAQTLEELDDEHGGEEGLLFDAKSEKGKLTAASIKARLKDIKRDPDANEERKLLEKCLSLLEKEREAIDAAKEAKAQLDAKTVTKYQTLSEVEAKTLVVEDKWMAALQDNVSGELDRVSQALTARVKVLTERYAASLPAIEADVAALTAKINVHLERMGVTI